MSNCIKVEYTDNDEIITIFANGTKVGFFYIEEHGNETMMDVRDMVVELGKELGIPVEVV